MDSLLALVTIVSLLLGAVMSLASWRLLRQSRQHAAARVEALQAMSAEEEDDDDGAQVAAVAVERQPAPRPAPAPAAAARFATLDDEPDVRAESTPAWDAIRERPAARAMPAPRRAREIHVRFAATDEPHAPARRWVALAGVAAVMAVCFGGVYALYSGDALARITQLFSSSAAASGATTSPLQLLSLKHTATEDGSFVVTGLVQNPASGQPRRGVIAVVYLFDREGRYFAGGKTPLEIPSLHPGEESPFVVTVPQASGVARYRVGFRLEDGGVVAHVDRRGQLPGGTVEDAVGDGEPVLPQLPRRSEG